MLLDNICGSKNLFEFKSNHFNSPFQADNEFKIKLLAENSLILRYHVGFEIELPLDKNLCGFFFMEEFFFLNYLHKIGQ